jgi:hypothetical protein
MEGWRLKKLHSSFFLPDFSFRSILNTISFADDSFSSFLIPNCAVSRKISSFEFYFLLIPHSNFNDFIYKFSFGVEINLFIIFSHFYHFCGGVNLPALQRH